MPLGRADLRRVRHRLPRVADVRVEGLGRARRRELILRKMVATMGEPRRRIDLVSGYFVPTRSGTRSLTALAKRGIEVNILTNALGGADEQADVALRMLRLEDGDLLLLCSDGLTDCVDDDTIARTLAADRPSSELCDRLLHLALERGGRDNITAVVAALRFSSWTRRDVGCGA